MTAIFHFPLHYLSFCLVWAIQTRAKCHYVDLYRYHSGPNIFYLNIQMCISFDTTKENPRHIYMQIVHKPQYVLFNIFLHTYIGMHDFFSLEVSMCLSTSHILLSVILKGIRKKELFFLYIYKLFCIWQALAKTLTVDQLYYLQEQFALLGPNKSGYISLQNLKTVSPTFWNEHNFFYHESLFLSSFCRPCHETQQIQWRTREF